jgi:MFS family permease
MSPPDRPFHWRSVAVAAFLPTLLFSIGEGAIIPIIPVIAADLGADLAGAGLIASMIVVGGLVGDIPSGPVVARVGERAAMIGSSVLAAGGILLAVFATDEWILGVGMFLLGLASSSFALARHAFLTSFVPLRVRARALSTLGGTFRLGLLLGPFLGAGTIALTGEPVNALWISLVGCAATIVVLAVLRDPAATFGPPRRRDGVPEGDAEAAAEAHGLFRTLVARRRVLLTLGIGSSLVSALRSARYVVLPLWAVSIGLDETTTSLIIGIAGIVDFSLFFAGGWIMDRFGRLWTAVPSLLGLGLGHLVLAFTHDADDAAAWFVGVAMFLSLANGIGAGILMTLGADLADPRNPAPFLGAWRFTNDFGGATAPLLVAAITALAGLPIAVAVLGCLGIVGAGVLRVFVPKYSPRH